MPSLLRSVTSYDAAGVVPLAISAGCLMGYVAYDCTHYFLHHATFGWSAGMRRLKSTHMAHHYKDCDHSFGVTNSFFDRVFHTRPGAPPPAPAPASVVPAKKTCAASWGRGGGVGAGGAAAEGQGVTVATATASVGGGDAGAWGVRGVSLGLAGEGEGQRTGKGQAH